MTISVKNIWQRARQPNIWVAKRRWNLIMSIVNSEQFTRETAITKTTVMRREFFTPFDRKRLSDSICKKKYHEGAVIQEKSLKMCAPKSCAEVEICCHVRSCLRRWLNMAISDWTRQGFFFSQPINAELGLLHNCVYPPRQSRSAKERKKYK